MTAAVETPSFSETLRKATSGAHAGAQGSPFVRDLLAGKLSRERYAAMVAQHYFIYDALERIGRELAGDPVASPFLAAELDRVPSLEADLAFLLGPSWRERISATAATSEYVARIRETEGDSYAFVAHHYVRYLGDLSGGQHIAKFISKEFGFGKDGARFYDFAGIPEPDTFKDAYRRNLDEAPWTDANRAHVVEESLAAYALNTRVLSEI